MPAGPTTWSWMRLPRISRSSSFPATSRRTREETRAGPASPGSRHLRSTAGLVPDRRRLCRAGQVASQGYRSAGPRLANDSRRGATIVLVSSVSTGPSCNGSRRLEGPARQRRCRSVQVEGCRLGRAPPRLRPREARDRPERIATASDLRSGMKIERSPCIRFARNLPSRLTLTCGDPPSMTLGDRSSRPHGITPMGRGLRVNVRGKERGRSFPVNVATARIRPVRIGVNPQFTQPSHRCPGARPPHGPAQGRAAAATG